MHTAITQDGLSVTQTQTLGQTMGLDEDIAALTSYVFCLRTWTCKNAKDTLQNLTNVTYQKQKVGEFTGVKWSESSGSTWRWQTETR